MSLSALKTYLEGPFETVDGWCIPHLFQTISACHLVQQSFGFRAPVAEIGVYHGKFLLGLAAISGVSSGHYAIDVFDMQEFNLDGAGAGNLERLKDNIIGAGFGLSDFEFYRADSMTITRRDINKIANTGPAFSYFSVDGCHMVEHTINDMRIAMDLTDPRGIVFIDDYYNAHWPGVQEGVSKLYFNETPVWVPLVATCNKLLLCHISYHARYLKGVGDFLRETYTETRIKKVPRFGYDTWTVAPKIDKPFTLTL